MATEKNIIMKQFNGTDYDILYPKTIASQVDNVYNKTETLATSTAALYGKDATAVPDEIFAAIRPLIATAQETANSRAKIAYGTYTGTGTYGADNSNRLTFDFEPQLVIVQNANYMAYDSSSSSDVKKAMLIMLRHLETVYLSQATMAVQIAWAGNDVSWYSTDGASYQLNIAENTYNYFALG